MSKGFRGGFGTVKKSVNNNYKDIIKNAQQMSSAMSKEQDEINSKEFTATAGGGAVSVVMTGDKKVKSLEIKPEIVDPEDIEMMQDLIVVAINTCLDDITKVTDEVMSKYTPAEF